MRHSTCSFLTRKYMSQTRFVATIPRSWRRHLGTAGRSVHHCGQCKYAAQHNWNQSQHTTLMPPTCHPSAHCDVFFPPHILKTRIPFSRSNHLATSCNVDSVVCCESHPTFPGQRYQTNRRRGQNAVALHAYPCSSSQSQFLNSSTRLTSGAASVITQKNNPPRQPFRAVGLYHLMDNLSKRTWVSAIGLPQPEVHPLVLTFSPS